MISSMAFRNDYDAQLQRNDALESELAELREKQEALEKERDALKARVGKEEIRTVSPARAARDTGQIESDHIDGSSIVRALRFGTSLGGLLLAVLVAANNSAVFQRAATTLYERVDAYVYLGMSCLLFLFSILVLVKPVRLTRLLILVWAFTGLTIEVVDNIIERVVIGQAAPIWYAALFILYPALLVFAFWKRSELDG